MSDEAPPRVSRVQIGAAPTGWRARIRRALMALQWLSLTRPSYLCTPHGDLQGGPVQAHPRQQRHAADTIARAAVSLVHILLPLLTMSMATSSCLPPDFTISAEENAPVRIDKRLLPVSPDDFHQLSGCPPAVLELDIAPAIVNPDGDRLYTAWLVNHIPGQGGRPDATSTTSPRPFIFNPCTNPKVLTGAAVNTIEFVVLDRPPASFDNGDDVKTIVDPETSSDNVVYFLGVEDLSCCGNP